MKTQNQTTKYNPIKQGIPAELPSRSLPPLMSDEIRGGKAALKENVAAQRPPSVGNLIEHIGDIISRTQGNLNDLYAALQPILRIVPAAPAEQDKDPCTSEGPLFDNLVTIARRIELLNRTISEIRERNSL